MRRLLPALALLAACAGEGSPGDPCANTPVAFTLAGKQAPFTGFSSERYARDDMWLCRPDLPGDTCTGDLTATEIRPDGSRAIVPHQPAQDPAADCFYVYPTVDITGPPGLHQDLADRAGPERVVMNQAARFTEACRVFAPLYRQVTWPTYWLRREAMERCAESAYADVLEAFAHYLGQHNQGRPIVLVGHSQGAQHLTTLLQDLFDQDPAMRERLLVAMVIGWKHTVAQGDVVGGTLGNLPLCTRPTQRGCIISFRSHVTGHGENAALADIPEGQERSCVHPGGAAQGVLQPFTRSFFARDNAVVNGRSLSAWRGITTPYVLYRDLYSGRCQRGADGTHWLDVRETQAGDDQRPSPFRLDRPANTSPLGLHLLDLEFTLGDLVDQVRARSRTP